MYVGQMLFAQLMEFLPRHDFDACVEKYQGNFSVKDFSCRDQFGVMVYAQLTGLGGLRGIQETLRVNGQYLYHMGFRCATVSRNTLAEANKQRPWRIYADLALILMERARTLYEKEPFALDLDAKVFALDSTTIDLCLTRFPWTPSQQSKAAVKMHTLLDLRGNIPDFLVISDGKTHDVHFLEQIVYLAGAYYIFDRGYLDFALWYRIHQARALFVTRAKKNLRFTPVASNPVDKAAGLRCDQTVHLTLSDARASYPERLRRVKYRDPETGKTLVFLTNDFDLPALMIAELYKQRWQIELFFKWIKQHLRIKKFYGYSENAVRTQLWIAVATYCLLAIARKELGGDRDFHEIQEILRVSLFQKIPIFHVFSRQEQKTEENGTPNQLPLFNLNLGH